MCVNLFLDSLFYSIDLCVYHCKYHSSVLKSSGLIPYVVFFYRKILAILVHLHFQVNLRIILSISIKNLTKILIRISLNLHINLGELTS